MTRIISGSAGGRRLATPSGRHTRPSSERVREGLFSQLGHLDLLMEARVLDLYAGSGALGLEAASRGAAMVTLIESDRATAAVARRNVTSLGWSDRVTVRCDSVERALLGGPGRPYSLVFADPPYDLGEAPLADVLALLVIHDWLAADAVVVIERSARSPEPRWPSALTLAGERRYGETKLWFAESPGPAEIA